MGWKAGKENNVSFSESEKDFVCTTTEVRPHGEASHEINGEKKCCSS